MAEPSRTPTTTTPPPRSRSTERPSPQGAVDGQRDRMSRPLLRRVVDGISDLYWGSGICDDVPALSWFLMAALVPLALGMTALASLLLGDYAEAQALAQRAARVLPPDVGDQLVQLVLRTQRDSPLLLAASLVAMVWASAGAVGVLERSMSRLLHRERFGPLVGKLRHLGLAAALSFVLVVVVLVASRATGLQRRLGLEDAVPGLILSAGALGTTIVVCAALYRSCPRGGISWRAAFAGAAPAGIGLQLIPSAVAYYLVWVAGTTPVHVFLVMAGVLFTCYLAALALLVGAAVAGRFALRTGGADSP
ncbi:MAG: Virulence factor BrkB [Solirubrobacteraceae bacterium]|nr:Virulence factor BrkB [Solirubrobacteraceae bacterium]